MYANAREIVTYVPYVISGSYHTIKIIHVKIHSFMGQTEQTVYGKHCDAAQSRQVGHDFGQSSCRSTNETITGT